MGKELLGKNFVYYRHVQRVGRIPSVDRTPEQNWNLHCAEKRRTHEYVIYREWVIGVRCHAGNHDAVRIISSSA
jgi:hypothetical protein